MLRTKIGQSEAIALLVTAISTKVLLGYPAVMVNYGGEAAWMIIIFSGLITLGFFLLITKFIALFPEQSLPAAAEEVVGPYLGGLIVLIILSNWVFSVALTLRIFSETMLIVALPETPLSVIVVTLLLSAGIAAYLGFNTIARASYLAFPFTAGSILLMLLLTYPQWEFDYLFPLFGTGLDQILKYGALRSSDFRELNLLFFFPLLFYPKQIRSIGMASVIISTAIFFLVVITYLLSFPSTIENEPYLPLYMMARSVYLGRFIQRIELLFALFWVVSGLLWISLGFYGAAFLISQWLKLPDYRPLLLPVGILIFALAFLPANLPDASIWSNELTGNISFLPNFTIIPLLLIIAKIRRKGNTANEHKVVKKK